MRILALKSSLIHRNDTVHSFDLKAEQTCEDLLNLALQIDPGNSEALQALASVRMSQNRPDEAKEHLSLAWSAWKDVEDPTDPRLPPLSTRLSLVKLFLELSLFTPALLVLHGIMASDDQEVEAWYLEGWCFFLMAEEAKEREGGKLDELNWEELAKDSRDCLETCQLVGCLSIAYIFILCSYRLATIAFHEPRTSRRSIIRACKRAHREARFTGDNTFTCRRG